MSDLRLDDMRDPRLTLAQQQLGFAEASPVGHIVDPIPAGAQDRTERTNPGPGIGWAERPRVLSDVAHESKRIRICDALRWDGNEPEALRESVNRVVNRSDAPVDAPRQTDKAQ